jgi:integral membrane sensor domain MASE1
MFAKHLELKRTAVHLPTKSTHSCQLLAAMLKAFTCQRPHCHFKTDHLKTTSVLDVHYFTLTIEAFASILKSPILQLID